MWIWILLPVDPSGQSQATDHQCSLIIYYSGSVDVPLPAKNFKDFQNQLLSSLTSILLRIKSNNKVLVTFYLDLVKKTFEHIKRINFIHAKATIQHYIGTGVLCMGVKRL